MHDHSDPPANVDELHDLVSRQLAGQDHRYTSGRRKLIDALAKAGCPITLPGILAQTPDLAPSSAYRNLDVLEQCNVIRRIAGGGDHAHFELAEPLLGHHHHLICVECGAIADIHLSEKVEKLVDSSLTEAAKDQGFTPMHHSLDLHGTCANCS